MGLTVLSVAYPFAPVGPDTAGGAEQVLAALDAALVGAGQRSIVLAMEGSQVAGDLVPVPAVTGTLSEDAREVLRREVRAKIGDIVGSEGVDLVHYHGVDFADYAVATPVPALATLHLPPDWYPPGIFDARRPGPWLNPVSDDQARRCPASPRLLAPIPNGIPVAKLQAVRLTRRGFGLVLARICPEKGIHLALQAAREAGIPLLVAGELFPYPAHQAYFAEEVAPLLDRTRRFIGPVGFARKRRLLAAARCLLVPSLAEETSSLVAREAIACGTPVIALRRGALPETVEDGVTGFLAEDAAGLAAAIARTGEIDPEAGRAGARRRFDKRAMTDRYLALYRELVAGAAPRAEVRA